MGHTGYHMVCYLISGIFLVIGGQCIRSTPTERLQNLWLRNSSGPWNDKNSSWIRDRTAPGEARPSGGAHPISKHITRIKPVDRPHYCKCHLSKYFLPALEGRFGWS